MTFKHLPGTQDLLAARAWLFAGAPSAHKDIDARHAIHTLIDLIEALPEIIPQYAANTPEYRLEMSKPPPDPPPDRKSRERVDMENAIYQVLCPELERLETSRASFNGHHVTQRLLSPIAAAIEQRAARRMARAATVDKLNWRDRPRPPLREVRPLAPAAEETGTPDPESEGE